MWGDRKSHASDAAGGGKTKTVLHKTRPHMYLQSSSASQGWVLAPADPPDEADIDPFKRKSVTALRKGGESAREKSAQPTKSREGTPVRKKGSFLKEVVSSTRRGVFAIGSAVEKQGGVSVSGENGRLAGATLSAPRETTRHLGSRLKPLFSLENHRMQRPGGKAKRKKTVREGKRNNIF